MTSSWRDVRARLNLDEERVAEHRERMLREIEEAKTSEREEPRR